MTAFTPHIISWALVGLLVSSQTAASERDGKGGQREIVVGCTSTVAYDTGGCLLQAKRKCKARARLVSVLANTTLADSRLHHITARYRCQTTAFTRR